MIRALCWKEYREQRAIWLAIAALTVLLIYGLGAALAPAGLATLRQDETLRSGLAFAAVSMAVAYGLVCGALLLAGEREAGTLGFLDVLAGQRAPVWTAKMLIGLALTLTQALLLATVALLAGLVRGVSPASYLAWLLLLAFDGYAWGLLGSALCRNVFVGAVLGAACLGASWAVTALMGWLLPGPLLASQFLMAAAAVVASGLIFCCPDRRRSAGRPVGVGGRFPDLRALVWLTLRQGKAEACLLLGAAAVLGALLPLVQPVVWLLLLAGVGVVGGTAVFAGDQADGRRFLGAARVPPGRVWAVKTACWAGVTALVAAVALLGTCAALVLRDLRNPAHGDPQGPLARYFPEELFPGIGRGWLLAVFLAYGFSAGQVVGLLVRKRVVALVVASAVAVLLLGLWLPSLLLGGLPLWQLFGPPVFLLGAGRLVMWPWLADRLQGRRSVVALVSSGALLLLWMAGSLWDRATEIPDVGPPFDRAAFEASLPGAQDNQARTLIRQGCRDLSRDAQRVSTQLTPAGRPLFSQWEGEAAAQEYEGGPLHGESLPLSRASMLGLLGSPPGQGPLLASSALFARRARARQVSPSEYYGEQLEWAIEHGWPKDGLEVARWLEELFAGDWAKQLRQAAALPLRPFLDPRSGDASYTTPEMTDSRYAAILFLARALQLQARGDDGAALDRLAVVLALSRHLRCKTPFNYVFVAWALERTALEGLDRWLAQLGPRPALLRRALDELQRHEEQTPPLTDNVKAEYYVFRNQLDHWYRLGRGKLGYLVPLAREAPWERARERRVVNALFAAVLKRAERPSWQEAEEAPRWDQTHWGRAFLRWLEDPLWSFGIWSPEFLDGEVWRRCRLRGERLRMALALYGIEEGKPAEKLTDLVPRYLAELPLDPFSGRPFGYRVSRGERIPTITDNREAGPPLDVAAGQGVVWSTGPDRQDNGGLRAGVLWSAPPGVDLIYLVPRWPKQ